MDCTEGCLFDVAEDWTEHENIADRHPEIVTKMANELESLKEGFYSNDEKGEDSCPRDIEVECACWMAINAIRPSLSLCCISFVHSISRIRI